MKLSELTCDHCNEPIQETYYRVQTFQGTKLLLCPICKKRWGVLNLLSKVVRRSKKNYLLHFRKVIIT